MESRACENMDVKWGKLHDLAWTLKSLDGIEDIRIYLSTGFANFLTHRYPGEFTRGMSRFLGMHVICNGDYIFRQRGKGNCWIVSWTALDEDGMFIDDMFMDDTEECIPEMCEE